MAKDENENGEAKTEKPTGKRLKEARKNGQVVKSQDVVSVCFVIGTFAIMRVYAPYTYNALMDNLKFWLGICGKGLEKGGFMDGDLIYKTMITEIVKTVVISSGIIMIAATLLTIISTGIQTKWLWTTKNLKFDIKKLNPLSGFQKLFSGKSVFEFGKSLLKFIIIGAVIVNELKSRYPEIIRVLDMEPQKTLLFMVKTVYDITMKVGIIFIAVAAVDYMYQKFTFDKDMRMTKQEVKDEYKSTEGDPKIKSKRRQKQYELHYMMMQNVKDADVVIRNPTHYAVAIKYEPEKNGAPIVVAKGIDGAALRIIELAENNNVSLVENRPLARALYEKTEVNYEIPFEFYREVAEVLAFVYDLKKLGPNGQKKNVW